MMTHAFISHVSYEIGDKCTETFSCHLFPLETRHWFCPELLPNANIRVLIYLYYYKD